MPVSLRSDQCYCGEPLHYASESSRKRVQEIIDESGRWQKVTIIGVGSFVVDRHYIALHGIKGGELVALGFDRVD